MAHKSDTNFHLDITHHSNTNPNSNENGFVCLFHYPTKRKTEQSVSEDYFFNKYSKFSEDLSDDSVICFLLDSLSACDLISQLQAKLHYRLWIAIERDNPLPKDSQLPDNHVSLVIFTKHSTGFKHSTTRIQYTLCPSCGRTTKDYGGKKHLYNPYGTLMSDVWRDIKYSEKKYPEDIIKRLSDLFAIESYKKLYYYNNTNCYNIFYKPKQLPEKKHSPSGSAIRIQSQLINGDCIQVLKTLPKDSIDFAFADPPYNIKKKYHNWSDDIHIEKYFSWCDEWIGEVYRVLKPGKTFVIINIPLWIVRHYLFAKSLFQIQDLIVWEGLGLPVRNIMPAHYGILCLSKGFPNKLANYETKSTHASIIDATLSIREWYCLRQSCVQKRNTPKITDRDPLTNLWWDIHRLKHNSKRVDHPCQLPPNLMRRLIFTFTTQNEMVLDPFNGAGTTSLVAALMGRKYIGVELSQEYHEIALNRHKEIANGLDPFRKLITTPKAKNSRVQRLRKQKYEVSKKALQLEVRDVAFKLGRKPTKEDLKENSQYPFHYFQDYFIDWGEVCAAVGNKGMSENPSNPMFDKMKQLTLFQDHIK